MDDLQLLHLPPELFNLLKFVVLDEMNELDALEKLSIFIGCFTLLGFGLISGQYDSEQVKCDGAVFTSVEAQCDLFRPLHSNDNNQEWSIKHEYTADE